MIALCVLARRCTSARKPLRYPCNVLSRARGPHLYRVIWADWFPIFIFHILHCSLDLGFTLSVYHDDVGTTPVDQGLQEG